MNEEISLNFEHLPSKCPKITLEPQQKETITSSLPSLQRIIHYMFWSKARLNAHDDYILLSVLSGNMISIYKQKNFRSKSKIDINIDTASLNEEKNDNSSNKNDYKFDIELRARINLINLIRIGYDSDSKTALINGTCESLTVKDKIEKINIQYLKDDNEYNLAFLQCIYRNYSINFSILQKDYFVNVYCNERDDYFPDIEIPLSLSQRFQFLYYAKCIEHKTEYIHQVVQYIHSLILLGMPIVDISKFPLISQDQEMLKPIFEALSIQKFVCGICCSQPLPNLMENIRPVFDTKSSNINLLHLENYNHEGKETGIENLNKHIKKKGSNISYWNLRGHEFEDMKYFINILKKTKENNLLFLDLSYCNLKESFIVDLYKTLAQFPSLQQLYMAGSENTDDVIKEFDNLLTQYELAGSIKLCTLDLSDIKNVSAYLQVINKHDVPLRSLKIQGVKFDSDASTALMNLINQSSTLRSLDLTNISCDDSTYLEKIILELNDNNKLKHFDLFMDSLKLNSGNLAPIFKVFLAGNDLETKWNSLSLNSNNLSLSDLKNLTPLLGMMNIRSLSMDDNFTSEMEGIDKCLIDLIAKCEFLEKLSIRGGENHKLGSATLKLIEPLVQAYITEIDFSNNDAGSDIYPQIQSLIKKRINYIENCDKFPPEPIKSISIDGNGLSAVKILEELITEIENTDVTKFNFPEKDCENILKQNTNNSNNNNSSRNEISQAKIHLVNTINVNRANKNMMPDLPFKATREMTSLINKITKKMRNKLNKNKDIKHTMFSKEYGLPLPFEDQKSGVKGEINKMDDKANLCETYHSSLINQYVEEHNDIQPDADFEYDHDSDQSSEISEQQENNEEDKTKGVKFGTNPNENKEDEKEKENNNDENNNENKEDENNNDNKEDENNNDNKEDENQNDNKEDDNNNNNDDKKSEDNEEDENKKDENSENQENNDNDEKDKQEEENEEDEVDRKKIKKKKIKKRRHRHHGDDDSDEEDEEDIETTKKKNKNRDKKKKDDEDDEKLRKSQRKRKNSRQHDSDDDDDNHHRKSKRKKRSSHDDSDDDEENHHKSRRGSKRLHRGEYDDSDDDESHHKSRRGSKRSHRGEYDDSDDDDENHHKSRRGSKRSTRKNDEDDEDENNYKNKKQRSRRPGHNNRDDDDDERNTKTKRGGRIKKDSDSEDERDTKTKRGGKVKRDSDSEDERDTKTKRGGKIKKDSDSEDERDTKTKRGGKVKKDSDSEDERPSSIKNKSKKHNDDSNYEEDDEFQKSTIGKSQNKDDQEKKADEEMDDILLNTSQNLGTFRISQTKSQRPQGKRRPPPTSFNLSQRRGKLNT